MATLLLVGATGLVGREVLRLALADLRVKHLTAPTRRPLPPHSRLANPQVDFDALPPDAPSDPPHSRIPKKSAITWR